MTEEKISLQIVLDLLRAEQENCLEGAAEAQAAGKEWRASAFSFAAQRLFLVCRKLQEKTGESGNGQSRS